MKAATKAKRKYNKANYGKSEVFLPKEQSRQFKEKCRREGISQGEVMRRGIREFMGWDDDV